MSDDRPADRPISRRDEELLAALDRLGPETEVSDRAAVETLALLPRALEELAPGPEVKRRLMAEITSSVEPPAAEPPPISASDRLVTLEQRSRWFLPIAAALAIALLGLTAMQFRQLQGQQRTIDELSAQLQRVEESGAELAEIRRALAEKGGHLRMLTSRGAEFCVLKPVGENPRLAQAIATMVIAPERDGWFLAAEGLEPCAADACYQLWFITEAEPIEAASFGTVEARQRIELSGSGGVPTSIRAISITRLDEPDPGAAAETVLYADQAMTLL